MYITVCLLFLLTSKGSRAQGAILQIEQNNVYYALGFGRCGLRISVLSGYLSLGPVQANKYLLISQLV